MFKYTYLKRLFIEAIILACMCFAAVFFAVYKDYDNELLIAVSVFVGLLAVMLAVFTLIYSRLYIRLEQVMDAAQQGFVLLRPRRKRFCIYGSPRFVVKFEEHLPCKPEISSREFDAFYTRISENPETLDGETFYRYSVAAAESCDIDDVSADITDDGEDIWVKIKRIPYGRKQALVVTDVTDLYLQKMYLMQSDYYDSASRLFSREAVLKRVQRFIDNGCKVGYYAILSVNGLERVAGHDAAETNRVISRLGEEYKKIEGKRLIIGKNSHDSFLFFFAGTYSNIDEELDGIIRTANSVIAENSASSRLSIACGYCDFPESADNLDDLVARTEFALYQAIETKKKGAVAFSAQKYAERQEEFRKARAVHEVIDNNSVDYYFQPIVNARNGKIFAYEALMRPVSDVKLTPLDILSVAAKDNCLVSVERMTIENVMRAVEANIEKLGGKKVFINTIPNMLLPREEFDAVAERYGSLFENTVMEITEDGNFGDENFTEFSRRCEQVGCTMALDDFGTGYSNESNLLKFQPAFIKLDRSLITNIDADEKKRTLVEGLVNFAKRHNVRIIAEGVETQKELEYAISIDVDLIQGYLTARPQPVFLEKISRDVSDTIVALNLKRSGRNGGKIYETQSAGTVDIVELALGGYSELHIKHSPIEIVGEATRTIEMVISVQDDMEASVTMTDCSLFAHPYVFDCEKNSRVSIEMKGMNKFFGGFNVPTGSELTVTGSGSCDMAIHTIEPVAFGSSSDGGFGKIFFSLTGKCSIMMEGENVVAFGGKYSTESSQISISGADIEMTLKGVRPIGVGASRGSAAINIDGSEINVINDGDAVLGIGNSSGAVSAKLSGSKLSFRLGGDTVTALGALERANGSIDISQGSLIEIEARAKSIVGVGARRGALAIAMCDSVTDVFAEGSEVVGIGDFDGETSVHIANGSVVSANINSASPSAISTEKGQIIIDGGNIISNAHIGTAHNSRGEKLRYYKLRASQTVLLEDHDDGGSGSYIAPVYDKCPGYVGIFVPEGTLPETAVLCE